jgi:type III secretion system YscI/HrpB-like protein
MDIAAAGNVVASRVPEDRLVQPEVGRLGAEDGGGRDLAADQAGLEEALKGPSYAPEAEPSAQDLSASRPAPDDGSARRPSGVTEAQEPGTLADAILQGIRDARETYNHKVDMINKQVEDVGARTPSVSELIKLQMDVMQLGMQQELTAKLSDKTSAGVQTLFRSQG